MPNLIVGGWGHLEIVRMPLRDVIGTTDETLPEDWCALGFKADVYNPVYSRIDLNVSRAWMEGEYGALNLGSATKIDLPPTPANEIHLYDEHGVVVGNLGSVCQAMGKDIAATAADGERTYAFEKPTFILTGPSVFPRIKITSVSVEVRIDYRQETVRCRMSNFGQWVLRDIKSGKSHWFAATRSAQALFGR